jgi:hypothetical protein
MQPPLFGLPAELRNMIYEYLPDGYVVLMHRVNEKWTFRALLSDPQDSDESYVPASRIFAYRLVRTESPDMIS